MSLYWAPAPLYSALLPPHCTVPHFPISQGHSAASPVQDPALPHPAPRKSSSQVAFKQNERLACLSKTFRLLYCHALLTPQSPIINRA